MEYIILIISGIVGGFLFSSVLDKRSDKASKEFSDALEKELAALDQMLFQESEKLNELNKEKDKEVNSEEVSGYFNDRNKH
jgi:hypothetical protein